MEPTQETRTVGPQMGTDGHCGFKGQQVAQLPGTVISRKGGGFGGLKEPGVTEICALLINSIPGTEFRGKTVV